MGDREVLLGKIPQEHAIRHCTVTRGENGKSFQTRQERSKLKGQVIPSQSKIQVEPLVLTL